MSVGAALCTLATRICVIEVSECLMWASVVIWYCARCYVIMCTLAEADMEKFNELPVKDLYEGEHAFTSADEANNEIDALGRMMDKVQKDLDDTRIELGAVKSQVNRCRTKNGKLIKKKKGMKEFDDLRERLYKAIATRAGMSDYKEIGEDEGFHSVTERASSDTEDDHGLDAEGHREDASRSDTGGAPSSSWGYKLPPPPRAPDRRSRSSGRDRSPRRCYTGIGGDIGKRTENNLI